MKEFVIRKVETIKTTASLYPCEVYPDPPWWCGWVD